MVCYRHHPDFEGKKPSPGEIAQAHAEHVAKETGIHSKLQEIQDHLHRYEADTAQDAKP